MTTRKTGMDAIEYAEKHGLYLSKFADPTEGERDGLTHYEAREIAREDPGLIYIDVEPITYASPASAWDCLVGQQGPQEFMELSKTDSVEEAVDDYLDDCPVDLEDVDVDAARKQLIRYIEGDRIDVYVTGAGTPVLFLHRDGELVMALSYHSHPEDLAEDVRAHIAGDADLGLADHDEDVAGGYAYDVKESTHVFRHAYGFRRYDPDGVGLEEDYSIEGYGARVELGKQFLAIARGM